MDAFEIIGTAFRDFPTLAQFPVKAIACYVGAALFGIFFIGMTAR